MTVLAELPIDFEEQDNDHSKLSDDDDDDDASFSNLKSNRRNNTRGGTSRRKSMSKLILSDDDESDEEDEDYDTAMGLKKKQPRKSKLCFAGDDDDSDDDDGYLSPLEHDKENNQNTNIQPKRKNHPDSVKKKTRDHRDRQRGSLSGNRKTPNPKPKKKRRRSSARFLRLSGRFGGRANGDHDADGDDDDDDDESMMDAEQREEKQRKLGEMYRQAIRLNAENKINAGNSWGLNLIENIDKFLGDDEEEADAHIVTDIDDNMSDRDGKERSTSGKEKRVNFTKASCTLDASVKIYSYRVDDVYLTSYKVLANLNRTDGSGSSNGGNGTDMNGDCSGGMDGDDDFDEGGGRSNARSNARHRGSIAAVKTVETNLGTSHFPSLSITY